MQSNFRKLINIQIYFSAFFTARLWSLIDSRLINLYSSDWEFQDYKWTIPTEGTEGGYIEVTAEKGETEVTTIPSEVKKVKVLAITESEVVLVDKANNSKSSQVWIKEPANSNGYFTLKNKGTGEFLQGDKTPMTSVKGT